MGRSSGDATSPYGELQPEGESVGTASEAVIRPRLSYGVRGQDVYDGNWAATFSQTWSNCNGFRNQLASTDNQAYYYNLGGAKATWETTGDWWGTAQGSTDVVDIFYAYTHGGNWTNRAVWAMRDYRVTADSNRMRLGDNVRSPNGGLSVLATQACDVLASADGGFFNRWSPVFRGGLRIAVGGWHSTYDVAGTGQSFAQRLQNGQGFSDAFAYANLGAYSRSQPAVASASTDAASCWPRLGAGLSNILSLPRVRDNAVGFICWVTWN